MHKTISIRFPRKMYEQLSELAKKKDRSVNRQVVRIVKEALKEMQPEGNTLDESNDTTTYAE